MISSLYVSCVREEVADDINSSIELTARMEYEVDTRTSLSTLEGGIYYPLWSAGDQIAVFVDDNSVPSRFVLKSGEGTTVASFTGMDEGNRYMALYPYDMAGTVSDGIISLNLPQNQEYVPDSFGQGAFPMIAIGSSDGSLKFMNLCSVLKVTLNGKAGLRSITLRANDSNIFISGDAKVNFSDDAIPELIINKEEFSDTYNEVKLNCNGYELDGIEDFYFVVPAQTYKGGFTIEVDAYSEQITQRVTKDVVFERSQIRNLKTINIKLKNDVSYLEKEKAALMKIYESLGGDEWYDKANWGTGAPLSEWSNVATDEKGHVVCLYLIQNNIKGVIPKEIGDLEYLESLYINYTQLTGSIPKEIGNLEKLRTLHIVDSGVEGTIPEELGNLKNLASLMLRVNKLRGEIPTELATLPNLYRVDLSYNLLEGEIPEQFGNCNQLVELSLDNNRLSGVLPERLTANSSLKVLSCFNNRLSGKIPTSIISNTTLWRSCWAYIIQGNDFDLTDVSLLGPSFTAKDIDNNVVSTKDLYEKNNYTLFANWAVGRGVTDSHFETLADLSSKYSERGLGIVGYGHIDFSDADLAREKMKEFGINWPYIQWRPTSDNTIVDVIAWNYCNFYPFYSELSYMLVDKMGNIIYYDLYGGPMKLKYYIYALYGDEDQLTDSYMSTDYSSDGTVETIQTATTGNGINIVLLGDGYSDRQIADGTYRSDMEQAYRNLFTEEPYKSHQDMFNVSCVNVVSATEGYEYNDTALGCGFGEGTYVYGNDQKCFSYAQNVVAAEDIDETLVVVVMNSDAYAGTCFMYDPIDKSHDFGSGASVAYFPKGGDKATFAQLLHHEACGHGFAKLADEYYYDGIIPDTEVTNLKNQNLWGWWKNTDFTSDPSQVKWAKFLTDERYSGEGLGVFEGAHTYQFGVYRPTDESIMRYNTGGFNAPSREAIYYRIHKLAYGDSWEYDYEKFVEYDAINRVSAQSQSGTSSQKRRANYVEKQQKPLAPPVIVGRTWK